MQFIQAKHYRTGGNLPVKRIVIHDMEAAEKGSTAENIATYFTHPAKPSSAHFNADSDSIVQSVREADVAFHAPPNPGSIGVEHAGYAIQTRAQWLDGYGQAMLARSAVLVAELCRKHDVPPVRLTVADLRAGKRGICGHVDVSQAFGQSDHHDPGPAFPWDLYMGLVLAAYTLDTTPITGGAVVAPPAPEQEDDLMAKITDEQATAVVAAAQRINGRDDQRYTLDGEHPCDPSTPGAVPVGTMDELDGRLFNNQFQGLREQIDALTKLVASKA